MEPSPSARRFDARLRLYRTIRGLIEGTDASDLLTVVSLALVFIGFTAPSIGAAVVGGLLVMLTPIGERIRFLIRGR